MLTLMLVVPPARLTGVHIGLQAILSTRWSGLMGGEQMGATRLVVDAIVLVEDVGLWHLNSGRTHGICGHTDAGDHISRVGGWQVGATRRRWR